MKERIEDGILEAAVWVMAHRRTIGKGVIAVGMLCLMGGLTLWIVERCKGERPVLVLEDTIASIEEVRPRGEIYVCSAVIEDYVMKRETERHLLMGTKEHSCVQTMTQKCSYVIDLDKVEYTMVDSLRMVWIKLPPLTYVASTQSASFVSDDSNYWAENLPNTNEMKRSVEEQIRRRFDTAENRRKAERYAEDAIETVMRKLGLEVEFVKSIESRKE